VGTTPKNTEAVTVKAGTVFVGKYEAVDFDSGEPVRVPEGASDEQVKQALKDAGVLGRGQKFYGGSAPANPDIGIPASAAPSAEPAQPAIESAAEPSAAAPAESAAAPAEVVTVTTPKADRPANWRGNFLQAARVAKSLGLDPKGKKLVGLVAEIDAKDGTTNAPAPAQPPKAARAKAMRGAPAYVQPAMDAVADFKDGDITREQLHRKFAELDMERGHVASVTNRIEWVTADDEAVQTLRAKPPASSPEPAPAAAKGQGSAVVASQPVESLGKTGTRSKAGDRARSRARAASPFKAFLGEHGLRSDLAREFAPGLRERRAAMVQGYGPLFRPTGMQLDLLAERAVEDGFLLTPDVAELSALIAKALRGERVIAQYAEGVAEAEAEAEMERRRDEMAAVADVAALRDNELDVVEDALDDSDIPWDADEGVRLSGEAAMRSMGFTEQEIKEISDETARQSSLAQADRQSGGEPVEAAQGAAPQDRGSRQEAPGTAEGLTAPTREDVLAQQAQRDAEQQRKDDGGDKPAAKPSPTGDQIDLLNPQGGIFDAPAEPAKEALSKQVSTLSSEQRASLEDHYGTASGSAEFLSRLRDDVVAYVNRGARAVAEAIRSAVKVVAEGVLAVGLIFNPMQLQDLSPTVVAKVQQAQETRPDSLREPRQERPQVPAEARARMSNEAVLVYQSLAEGAAASGKGFIIADKPNGMLHVFSADGSLLAQDAALYGKDKGDTLGASALEGGKKITPAGRYTLQASNDAEYAGGKLLRLVESYDDTGYIAVHAAWLGDPKEGRAGRLASASADDNRISYGCINTSHATFLKAILPNIDKLDGGMLVVLPDNPQNMAAVLNGEAPMFSKAEFKRDDQGRFAPGLTRTAVDDAVSELTRTWLRKPAIHVIDSMAEAPERVYEEWQRQNSQGAAGEPEGFHYRGEIYLLVPHMRSEQDVQRVLNHETFHFGLRGYFGKAMNPMLEEIVATRKFQVAKKAREYGLNMAVGADRLMAAEEVLAELAQSRPELDIVQRAIAIIRSWLRENIAAFKDLALTDNEVIERFILPARGYAERGRNGKVTFGAAPARAQASLAPRTIEVDGVRRPIENGKGQLVGRDFKEQQAFWKWFGDSAVKDEQGRPLVVFHGTAADFKTFRPGLEGGMWFASSPESAEQYGSRFAGGQNVMPVYLSARKPYELTRTQWERYDAQGQLMPSQAAERGYDSFIVRGEDGAIDFAVVFNPNQIKSATGNNGNFDPNDDRVAFSKKSVLTGQDIPNVWQGPDASKLDDMIYSMQDKHVDTRRVMQAVRAAIGSVADAQDPYLQEELFHGRAATATKSFLEKSLRPLLGELQSRGIDMSDFEEYLHNRHAERRNVQVAKVNPGMPDGGSGIDTADARAYLAGLTPAQRSAYQALAQRVDAINRETRALLVSSGLEKQTTIDAWQAAYGDEYVPLMREDMDNAGTGIGQGYSIRGSSSKRALGSNKPVANIIANIALQREKAITRAEKRRIGEALYGLAIQAPNDDFWFAVDPELQRSPSQVTAAAIQLISMGLDPADAASIAKEPTQSYIDPVTKQVTQRINPALRGAANVLAVRIDGEDKYVFFNSKDARAMRMVTALKNLDADQLGTVMGSVAKMTRYFSAINTQYNPIFGVTNLTRDLQTALLNLNSTALKDHKADVMKHVLAALRGIYIDLRDHRAGKQPTSTYAAIFEEFQREGGATGFRDMYANAQDRAEAIGDELKAIKQGKAMAVGRGIMGWLSDYNESMENAVRVSAYKVAKEQGMSNQQAASLAKNLTVNFNRKGQVALQAGALYAFFNASVQGTARIAQTLFADGKLTATGQKIIAGGVLLGSMQALLLAAAGFDDEEPPDFVRERSLVFPVGGDKYVSIPMPLGFHILPNLGRIPTEWVMGGFRDTPKRIGQLVGLFADAFNPMGSAGLSLQTLTPTIIDPLAALSENRDFTGKPIAKKDFDSLNPTAGHTRAKDTATPWARLISYGLNVATGGSEFKPGLASPTPDQIDYLIGQVTGGVGREAGKLSQVASSSLSGEELPLYKVPLVGRFVGSTEGQAAEASRFYNNLRTLGAHKVELDGLGKENRLDDVVAYRRDNPETALVPMAERLHREVAKLQKNKRALIDKGMPADNVKFLDARATMMMKSLNDRMRALKD
jgi:hypothetical protein